MPDRVSIPPVEVRKSLAISPGGELGAEGYVMKAFLVATVTPDPVSGIARGLVDYVVEVETAHLTDKERVTRKTEIPIDPSDAAILVMMR